MHNRYLISRVISLLIMALAVWAAPASAQED